MMFAVPSRRRCRRALVAFAGIVVLFSPPAMAADAVVDLATRPDVTERYLAVTPLKPPKAAVILFPGGQGVLNIPDKPGPTWAQNGNFLVRARGLFRDHGLFVAVLDAPSDRKGSRGLGEFRIAPELAEDIAAVIADVRRRSGNVPVWLVGTSRGTISAANGASRLTPPRGADGLVLTSTATVHGGGLRPAPGQFESVYEVDLAAIRLPTLIVSHRNDSCVGSPPGDGIALQRKLTAAPRTEIVFIDGGDPPRSEPCEALAAHGYLGVEAKAVDAIVNWILAKNH
jgi:pimeloyl-ACP methyl ester carboxylesterase